MKMLVVSPAMLYELQPYLGSYSFLFSTTTLNFTNFVGFSILALNITFYICGMYVLPTILESML